MSGTIKHLLPSFLEYLKFEKRYSEHTVISYETDMVQLDDFISLTFGQMGATEISAAVLRSWLADMKNKGMNTRSINRKISAIKSFYRHQLRKGALTRNPATVLKLMKTSKRLPGFLQEEETGVLMNAQEGSGWKDLTRQLFMEVLYNTGLRVSELVGLREKYADVHQRQIKVLGKGNKERVIPIKPELAEHIQQYRDAKRARFETFDEEYLLVNSKGKKLNTQYVYREVREELAGYNNISKKSPHLMRHTFATQLAKNGADLNAIKELLGHASLAATQVYTHNTIEKLKDIHKKAHPKA
jgi:integrase/recombinase XerC